MTKRELIAILNNMYFNSPDGELVASIHVFGIRFAEEIKATGATFRELTSLADIPASYATELSKGVKLAKYVTVKQSTSASIQRPASHN